MIDGSLNGTDEGRGRLLGEEVSEASLTAKTGIVGLGKMANGVGVLLVNALFARAMSKAEYGDYQYVWLVFNALLPLFLLGLPTSLLYFYPQTAGRERERLILRTATLLALSGLALVLLLHFVSPALSDQFQNPTLPGRLRRFSLYMFSIVSTGFIDALLLSSGRHRSQAAIALLYATSFLVLASGAVLLGSDLEGLFWVFSILGAVRMLCVMGYAARVSGMFHGGPGALGWGSIRDQMRYAYPIGASDAIGTLARFMDKAIIARFFLSQTFAVYWNGAMEVPFIGILLSSVSAVLTPELNRLGHLGETKPMHHLWHRAISKTALIVLPVTAFCLLAAHALMVFLFSAKYAMAAWPFRIYLLALPLRSAMYAPMILALGRPKIVLWGALGDMVLNGGVSILLIKILRTAAPDFAFLGPALSTVALTYLHVLFLLWFIKRSLSLEFSELLPWKRLRRAGMASLVGMVPAIPVFYLPIGAFFSILIAGVLFLPVYLWTVARWEHVGEELWGLVKGGLRRQKRG